MPRNIKEINLRKMNFVKLYFLLFITLVFIACADDSFKTHDVSTFKVTRLEGSGWTNYSYQCEINQDGILSVELENEILGINKKSTYKISEEELKELTYVLQRVMNVEMKDSYGNYDDMPTDQPTYWLAYETKEKYNRTSGDLSKAPKVVQEFSQTVYKIIARNDTLK